MEFISIVPWTMIAQIGNVIILFFFMKKILFHRVQAVLQKRMDSTNRVYEEADAIKSEAQELYDKYESLMKGAKADAEKIIDNANAAAREKSDTMIALAQKDTQYMLSSAKEEIRQSKVKAADEMRRETADIAIQLAAKILEREIHESDHRNLILQTIEGTGETL